VVSHDPNSKEPPEFTSKMFLGDGAAGFTVLSFVAIAIAEIIACPAMTLGNDIFIFPFLLLAVKVFF
jgi:hypothetical protein